MCPYRSTHGWYHDVAACTRCDCRTYVSGHTALKPVADELSMLSVLNMQLDLVMTQQAFHLQLYIATSLSVHSSLISMMSALKPHLIALQQR